LPCAPFPPSELLHVNNFVVFIDDLGSNQRLDEILKCDETFESAEVVGHNSDVRPCFQQLLEDIERLVRFANSFDRSQVVTKRLTFLSSDDGR